MKEQQKRTYLAAEQHHYNDLIKAAGSLSDGSSPIQLDPDRSLFYATSKADLSKIKKWIPSPDATKTVSTVSGADPVNEFESVLRANGFLLDGPPVMDGKRHRCAVEGDKGTQVGGAYTGYLDGHPAGWYLNFRQTNDPIKWKATGKFVEADKKSQIHLKAINAQKHYEREAVHQHKQDHAAQRCRQVYDLLPPASEDHQYLKNKGVKVYPGLKIDKKNRLVIPLTDEHGHIRSFSRISPNGFKQLKKNGQKIGCYYVLNQDNLKSNEPVLYAEGYATAASIAEAAPNSPVVMTIDAGNMPKVAAIFSKKYPDKMHLFLADDDKRTKNNKGVESAIESSKIANGYFITPAFHENDEKYSDFNDLHKHFGISEVSQQIKNKIITAMKHDNKDNKSEPLKNLNDDVEIKDEDREQENLLKQRIQQQVVEEQEQEETIKEVEKKIASAPKKEPENSIENANENILQKPSELLGIAKKNIIDLHYVNVDDRYYFRKSPSKLAFIDKGEKLITKHQDQNTVHALIDLAEDRGWSNLKIKGSKEFRHAAWLEASARGLTVKGYEPSKNDLAELKARTQEISGKVTNKVNETIDKYSGNLVDHGSAPYQNDKKNRGSYFVTLENEHGRYTHWGVDFERAVSEADVQVGDSVQLTNTGRRSVTVSEKDKEGRNIQKEVTRNTWQIKADVLKDRDKSPQEIVKEHPDLVNEVAVIEVAKKFADEKLDESNRGQFLENVRDRVANNQGAYSVSLQKAAESTTVSSRQEEELER